MKIEFKRVRFYLHIVFVNGCSTNNCGHSSVEATELKELYLTNPKVASVSVWPITNFRAEAPR